MPVFGLELLKDQQLVISAETTEKTDSNNNEETEAEIPQEVEESQLIVTAIQKNNIAIILYSKRKIYLELMYLHGSSYLAEIFIPPLA